MFFRQKDQVIAFVHVITMNDVYQLGWKNCITWPITPIRGIVAATRRYVQVHFFRGVADQLQQHSTRKPLQRPDRDAHIRLHARSPVSLPCGGPKPRWEARNRTSKEKKRGETRSKTRKADTQLRMHLPATVAALRSHGTRHWNRSAIKNYQPTVAGG